MNFYYMKNFKEYMEGIRIIKSNFIKAFSGFVNYCLLQLLVELPPPREPSIFLFLCFWVSLIFLARVPLLVVPRFLLHLFDNFIVNPRFVVHFDECLWRPAVLFKLLQ